MSILRWILAAFVILLAPGVAWAALNLEGTWHVLIHYKDSSVPNADAERWEDRLWVLERKGDRLEWTDYPIVVFEDQTGRFDRLSTNRASRVLHYWEPTEAQLQELYAGTIQFNERGSTSKKLRGSDAQGWNTKNRNLVASASIISYSVELSIEDPTGNPVFTKSDVMGSLRTESMDGVTRYRTEVVEDGGDVLRGEYERDGTRHGTFRLLRTTARRLEQKTQEKRSQEAFQQMIDRGMVEVFGARLDLNEIREDYAREVAAGGELPDEVRKQLLAEIRESVEDGFRARGVNPRDVRSQVESLSRKVLNLVEQGKSEEEIQKMFQEGQIRP